MPLQSTALKIDEDKIADAKNDLPSEVAATLAAIDRHNNYGRALIEIQTATRDELRAQKGALLNRITEMENREARNGPEMRNGKPTGTLAKLRAQYQEIRKKQRENDKAATVPGIGEDVLRFVARGKKLIPCDPIKFSGAPTMAKYLALQEDTDAAEKKIGKIRNAALPLSVVLAAIDAKVDAMKVATPGLHNLFKIGEMVGGKYVQGVRDRTIDWPQHHGFDDLHVNIDSQFNVPLILNWFDHEAFRHRLHEEATELAAGFTLTMTEEEQSAALAEAYAEYVTALRTEVMFAFHLEAHINAAVPVRRDLHPAIYLHCETKAESIVVWNA